MSDSPQAQDAPVGVYEPTMTPGRVLYERWLWEPRRIPPDDLWDHLDDEPYVEVSGTCSDCLIVPPSPTSEGIPDDG